MNISGVQLLEFVRLAIARDLAGTRLPHDGDILQALETMLVQYEPTLLYWQLSIRGAGAGLAVRLGQAVVGAS